MEKKKKIFLFSSIGIALATVIFLLWFLSGDKVGPGTVQPEKKRTYSEAITAKVEIVTVTEWYNAVGTVVPKIQARIEPRVTAQVMEVLVRAGDPVEKGDILVRLEDARLNAKLSQSRQSLQSAISQREQARQRVHAAEAVLAEADLSHKRIVNFYEAQAATEQELEQSRSQFLQAQAALQRAKDGLSGTAAGIRLAEEMVHEATIALRYTRIVAPAKGMVLKRLVDPGDMATPGKPLLILREAGVLQLEAYVRESLINSIRLGDLRKVKLSTLNKTVEAIIDEIVPFIDPQTRTFLVKADLPEVEGAYSGMYGKLMIPYAEVPVILIPYQAVRRVGQLQMVMVKNTDGWQERYIKTGNMYDGKIEILSGLSGGDTVLVEEPETHGDT
ncbi:MAG: efflux RND transporter periplasmic adaptor subunit [Desulfopila sp.]